MKLLEVEKYQDTFGPKAQRKKPKLESQTYDALLAEADLNLDSYDIERDRDITKHQI